MAQKVKFKESLEKLQDVSLPFSTGALYAFSTMEPENQARFEQAWPHLPLERRQRAIASIVELAEEDVELDFGPVLFLALDDQDAQVRGKAIEGLWEDESRELLGKLLKILESDPSEQVREKAAKDLSKFAFLAECGKIKERWTEKLRNGLTNAMSVEKEMATVGRRALEALGFFGQDERVIKAIQNAYQSDDELIKASAIKAMGNSLNRRWIPEVGKELGSPETLFRFEAVRAAGELSSEELVPPVIELLEDEDREVEMAAIWSLGQIGGAEASIMLKRLMNSENETVSTAAEEALAELNFTANPLNVLS